MEKAKAIGQRLVGLFLLGNLLFNFPLLALFNRSASVLDIPLLYLYTFASWAFLIMLLVLVAEQR